MNHDSTLYIQKDILERIENAADLLGCKRNLIILFLFKFAMKDYKYSLKSNAPVEYQTSSEDALWETIHVWYPENLYCFANMMRFLYRKSMSFILAESVRKNFHKIVKFLLNTNNQTTDNYQFNKYKLSYKVNKNSIIWEETWEKIKKYKKTE